MARSASEHRLQPIPREQSSLLSPRRQQQHPPYTRVTAAAVAAMASDHGRKAHELPWLYLDSVGQEYGPVPGWTMREWLALGRFPVGRELRVRLPEWEQHLPLHQLFPDLSTAFVLPPAWPSVYVDDVLQGEEGDSRVALAAARARASDWEPRVGAGRETIGSRHEVGGEAAGQSCAEGRAGTAASSSPTGGASAAEVGGRWVPLPRLWMAGMTTATQQRPMVPQLMNDRFMRQEEPILPPPPPQPSQQQLQELLSQPQEGPPLWEDDRPYQCVPEHHVNTSPFVSIGPCSVGDGIHMHG
mmetsp:Transcript_15009/g.35163  ORF Transcript_15009/g.35163 Transcript_15009/m.35163 type:complete len:300 (+) Transcript_15009:82-981(+)